MSGLYESVMQAVAFMNQVPLTDARLLSAHETLRRALVDFPLDAETAATPYTPYLSDRADGCKGHYAVARLTPNGTREVWNLCRGGWSAFSDGVLSEAEAMNLLKEITMPSPLARSQAAYEGLQPSSHGAGVSGE